MSEQVFLIEEGVRAKRSKKRIYYISGVILALVVVIAIVLAVTLRRSSSEEVEPLIVHNARVYTVDIQNPSADAFVVHKGKFVYVGTYPEALDLYPDADHLDVNGSIIIPGLIDAHAHFMNLGLSKLNAELYYLPSVDAVIQTLEDFVEGLNPPLAPGQWILGRGWDQTYWGTDEFPTKDPLDAAFPTIPVWLKRVDGHAGWANTAALKLADIPLNDPEGGQILRDELGNPTGIFVDSAMDIIEAVRPPYTHDQYVTGAKLAGQECVKYGLTGVHEAGVTPEIINVYKELIDSDEFPIRNYVFLSSCGTTYCGDDQYLLDYGTDNGRGGLLTVRSVKLYLDGALGSWGAAMIEPYSDNPTEYGLLQLTPEQLSQLVEDWMFKGWQVNTHAIGDRANQLVIDALEAVIRKDEARGGPGRQLRHRIEHMQIIQPEDVARLSAMQIIPSMQPTHATSDMRWAESRIGPDRLDEAYPWRSALNATGIIALGSDFPVEEVNPMLGVYAAVTRQNASGWPEGGWLPNECLTRAQTLKGFTLDAAYAAFQENELGSITVGKWADFVALDTDIMNPSLPPTTILSALVRYTFVGGKCVYHA